MATPSKVAKKERIKFQKLGAAKMARCRNRQKQRQGAVPAEFKIPLHKDKNMILSTKLIITTPGEYKKKLIR
jgi:hypothetical protein